MLVEEKQKQFYSVTEASALLEVSDDTIRRMIADGTLEGVKVRGQWRIRKESVDRILKPKGGENGR